MGHRVRTARRGHGAAFGSDLNPRINRRDDVADGFKIPGLLHESPIQVDDVNDFRTDRIPFARHCHRIVSENSFGIHAALQKAHAFSIFNIHGGNDDH